MLVSTVNSPRLMHIMETKKNIMYA